MKRSKFTPYYNPLLSILTVLIITFVCYIPALFNNFVNYDDPTLLFQNTIIHNFSFHQVIYLFKSILSGHYSRFNPLVFTTYMIIHHFVGFTAFWFHAVNILFHLGTTLIVFLLAKEITQNHRLSLICSLLFGVHPVHVEPVAWISALTHGMYTFFYLLSVYIFCVAFRKNQIKTSLILSSFFIFVIAGTCFSGGVITLPLVLLLLMSFREKGFPRNQVWMLLPFFLLSLYFAVMTFYTAQDADVIINPYFNFEHSSLLSRVNLSVISILYYVQKIIFPHSFTIVYPQGYFLPQSNIWISILFILFILLLFFNNWRFFQLRYFSFGIFFFLITIAPFLKIYSTSDSVINDRYVYLASFGLFLMLAECIDFALFKFKKSVLLPIILISILCYLIIITWSMVLNWRNGETLWSHLIKTYPKAYPAYLGRANYYIEKKDFKKTLEDCDAALVYNPHYVEALFLKGNTLVKMKRYQEAMQVYTFLLKLNPTHSSALSNRGAVLFLLGEKDAALSDLNRAIKLKPNEIDAYYNRSLVFIKDKRYQDALKDLRVVTDKDPGNKQALFKIEEIKELLMP